eukprot:334214-Hanusia_phi.AAC.4
MPSCLRARHLGLAGSAERNRDGAPSDVVGAGAQRNRSVRWRELARVGGGAAVEVPVAVHVRKVALARGVATRGGRARRSEPLAHEAHGGAALAGLHLYLLLPHRHKVADDEGHMRALPCCLLAHLDAVEAVDVIPRHVHPIDRHQLVALVHPRHARAPMHARDSLGRVAFGHTE